PTRATNPRMMAPTAIQYVHWPHWVLGAWSVQLASPGVFEKAGVNCTSAQAIPAMSINIVGASASARTTVRTKRRAPGTAPYPSSPPAEAPFALDSRVADAGVQERVQHVHDQVRHDDEQRGHHRHAHRRREVVRGQRVDCQLAHAG